MSADDAPRAYTPEEMRQIMLLYFRTMVHYWATIKVDPEDLVKMGESDVEYRLSVPHPEDQADAAQNGRNWFECVTINDCMLHDEWHKTK